MTFLNGGAPRFSASGADGRGRGEDIMTFSSIEFLFLFLPVVLAGYYACPRKFRNLWLLVGSLLFYAWGEPTFVLIMIGSIVFNYVMALAVEDSSGWLHRLSLAAAVVGNVGLLGVYKYLNFLTATLRDWFPGLQEYVPQTGVVLPIGISFFSFQAISYLVDVHRGVAKAQRNPLKFALYIAFFPQLIAGPIVRYVQICRQLDFRRETIDGFSRGVFRFLIGLNKKILIANALSVVVQRSFCEESFGCDMAWLGACSFAGQLYFDFSGYSDMAIGLGLMFGFRLPENFDHPFAAGTIGEFWRRWHMTLTGWFRDYVFFAVDGHCFGRFRLVFKVMLVWSLTGLWHGADWNFILWGAIFGMLMLIERRLKIEQHLARAGWAVRALSVFLVFIIFALSSVLPHAGSFSMAGSFYRTMFDLSAVSGESLFWIREYWYVFLAAVIGSFPVWKGVRHRGLLAAGYTAQLVLAVVSVMRLLMENNDPFLYFAF